MIWKSKNDFVGAVQDLFLPKKVVVVQYGLVNKPVTVVSEKIEMDWMWKNAPGLADFVEDLPVGAHTPAFCFFYTGVSLSYRSYTLFFAVCNCLRHQRHR
jgi:hypothetical protein